MTLLPRDYSKNVKRLQQKCQKTIAKMLEYLSFLLQLQCITTIILGATAYYLYSLIKMANEIIDVLLLEVSHDPPKSEIKRQKLIEWKQQAVSEKSLYRRTD